MAGTRTSAVGLEPRPQDLAADELQVLASLDDGFSPEDSAGRRLSAMSASELGAMDALLARRLCRMLPGWDESWWAVLTGRGRSLLAQATAGGRFS